MLGLKTFVPVQTFQWRPFVHSHNFCHPTENQDLSLIQENLWYLKTFTFSFNQNAPLPFVPFLLNAWWMCVVVCPKSNNKQSLKWVLMLKSLKMAEVPSFYECWPLFFTNIFNWVRTARVSCDKSVALFICWGCTLTFVTFVYLFVYCPPWLHFWLLWPPHLATWHLAGSNISLC